MAVARLLGGLAGAWLLAAALPGVAWAHANLERAEPAAGATVDQAPPRLRLSFSEAIDGGFSRVQVLNAKREQVDRGDSRVAPDDPRALTVSLPEGLPDGVYTVVWRTLSAVDGHTVTGAYPLIVGALPAGGGQAEAPVGSSEAAFAPETAIGRWWFSLAASALFGVLLAWSLVFAPLFGRSNPAALAVAAGRARRVAVVAGLLLLAGTLYGGLAQAATSADVPLWGALGAPLVELLTRGRYALLWWPRLGLVLVALALVSARGVRRWPGRLALGATAGALLTSSLNSHGAALASGPYLGAAADWLHFLGVAAWIGGLVSLVFVLPTAVRASARVGERVRAEAVASFSKVALVAVGVIVATGTFQAWLEVGSWAGLVQTAYGHSLMTKVGLLAVMLLLGAFNLLVARPRLAALAGKGSPAAAALARRFACAVRAEVALGALVLLVAAILTGLSPAREELARRASGDAQAGPVDRRVDAQGLSARVRISPARLGQNHFAVDLPGTDPATVERVQLSLTYLDAELGSQPLVLEPVHHASPPSWQADSALLSQAGAWQAELLVRRAGQEDARSALRFGVAGAGGAPASAGSGAVYPLLPSPLTSLAYLLLGVGAAVVAWAVLRRGRRARQGRASLLGAGLCVLACGGYVYGQELRGGVPLDVANVRNPVPPDERSLAAGEAIYAADCAACHGDTGRGDGPAGMRLVPRPADLRVHMAAGHTDGQLFYWVSFGVQGTAMPAWQGQLSEEQRWDVINYIRTFADPNAAPGR